MISYLNFVQDGHALRALELDGLGTAVKYEVTYPDGHKEFQWSITFKENDGNVSGQS